MLSFDFIQACEIIKGFVNVHSKKCWVVLTQFWVKYGQTQLLGYIFKLNF